MALKHRRLNGQLRFAPKKQLLWRFWWRWQWRSLDPENSCLKEGVVFSGGVIPMKSHDSWNVGKRTISFPHKFLQTSCYPVSLPENANFKRIGSKHPNSLWHDHGPPWHKIIGFSQIRLRLTLGMMQIEWLHDERKQRSMQSWEYNRLQTSPISDLQVDVLS